MVDGSRRLALFVDFENFFNSFGKGFKIRPIIQKLSEHGVLSIRRAYGDWCKYEAYRKELVENGLELIDQPALASSGKNGADIKLATDAIEAVFLHPDIDVYAIASGDSDFIPLVRKLREHGRYVIVLSSKVLAAPIIQQNCDEFIPCEIFGAGGKVDVDMNAATNLFKQVIRIREDRGDAMDIPQHKNMMLKLDPSFHESLIGFASFKDFVEAIIKSQDLPYRVERDAKSNVNYLIRYP
ncbi:MAG: NYN domain-containing protein [Candidatus Lokiarchaeota archaeon]|nr:NYN domain-containing protein [Candidatus Lokiarchaeota archaeon]